MKNIKSEKGITMITLAVTILIMTILIVTVNASISSTIEIKAYNAVKEDIISLTEAVKLYYLNNGVLPVNESITYILSNYGVPSEDINPNDSGNYYFIKTSLLSGINLNNGDGNKNNNYSTNDVYVVNEKSLTVYYLKGAVLEDKRHYTIVDDFSGGAYAEEYYTKVNLPIISVVTMESDGTNKSLAGSGDTITLKILSNYEFTTKPTVTINGEAVEVIWNGQIGTATYVLPWKTANNYEYGKKISFSISDYTADGRTGTNITEVNFGEGVYAYAKNLVELYKSGMIQTGDYLNYSDYVNSASTYTSVTNENGWADQTYTADTETQWRVLGLSKDGTQLMLISADPIKKDMDASSSNTWNQDPYLYMKGAYSYVNCIRMLDGISGIYSTSLGTARSMTIDDINNILGVTVAEDGVYQEDAPTTNIDQCGALGNKYTYTATDFTPESYIDGKSYATAGDTVDTTAYYYSWGDLSIDSTIQEILFEGTTSDDNNAKSYWLASPGVDCDSFGATFGPGDVSWRLCRCWLLLVRLEWHLGCRWLCGAPRSLSKI